MLGPVERRARDHAVQHGAQEHLRAAAVELPGGRKRRDELDELVVEQRRADLQRVRHAHPVDLDQDVVAEVRGDVDVEDSIDGVGRLGAPERTAKRREGIELLRLRPQPRAVEPRLEPRHLRREIELSRAPVLGRQADVEEDVASLRADRQPRRRPGDGATGAGAEDPSDPMLERLHPVPAVAREQLVTAVARQRDGNVLTRRHGDEVRGDGRRVGERLVEVPDEPLDQLRRRRRHDPWVVLAADVTRHHGRVGQLAVAVVEADRGRDHRAVQEPGHGGDDRARIHAAAQEGAERHVAPQPDLDGLGQELVEAIRRVGTRLRLGQGKFPVPMEAGALGRAHQSVTSRQLAHAPEDRVGRRDVEQAGITVQRLDVDVPLHGGVLEQRLQLGGEHEGLPRAQRIIERLFAQSIASEE